MGILSKVRGIFSKEEPTMHTGCDCDHDHAEVEDESEHAHKCDCAEGDCMDGAEKSCDCGHAH